MRPFRLPPWAVGAMLAGRVLLGLALADEVEGAGEPVASSPDSSDWRRFGNAAFEEARQAGKPVFLVLTAPWNWDHFLLPSRLFGSDEVWDRVGELSVPVLADVSLRPELARIWRISSGLVPSFHFLDPDGVAFASFPPHGEDELLFYLEEYADPASAPRVPPPVPAVTIEMRGDELADRIARFLLDLQARGRLPLAPIHEDLDVSCLTFLVEYGTYRLPRRTRDVVEQEVTGLLDSPLIDRVDGGFHRAFATEDRRVVHHEKTLRTNAELGGVLSTWFRTGMRTEIGRDAFLVVRFLNERLRTRGTTLYVESMAADVFDASATELRMSGDRWYGLNDEGRKMVGIPPVSAAVPVGANWRLHQELADYYRTFADERMKRAVARGGSVLLAEGLEPDGSMSRVLGKPGVGNLRDQGDGGSGLLTYHGLTGDPAALDAARRLGDVILRRFLDPDTRLPTNVARDADDPEIVHRAPPDPAAHGAALRFLAELSAVTGEERWREAAERALEVWAGRIPDDGRGVGELGRAAMRLEKPPPVIALSATRDSERARELLNLAYRISDRMVLVRWVEPGDQEDAESLGVRLEEEPALWIVWGDASPAVRKVVTLQHAYRRARERIWP